MLLSGISQLESCSEIEVMAQGVFNRFKIRALPGDINHLAKLEYNRCLEREARELARLREVVDFIFAKSCRSRILMNHFGEVAKLEWNCAGTCSNCRTDAPKVTPPDIIKKDAAPLTNEIWKSVLLAVNSGAVGRDDRLDSEV